MIKKFSALLASFILSFIPLFVMIPKALAAVDTCTWIGEGVDDNFSTAANWTGCDNGTVPESGDSLTFDDAVTNQAPINDMTSMSFATITFSGTGMVGFSISGNAFTLTNGITAASGDYSNIYNNITLSGNQTINVGSSQGVTLDGVIDGSGNITKTGTGVLSLYGANSSYSGAITVSAGLLIATNANALGTVAVGTTVADGGSVLYSLAVTSTIAEPFTLAGNGNGEIFTSFSLGVFPEPPSKPSITFSGAVILSANTFVSPGYEMKFTGALTGSFTVGVAETSEGTLIISSSSNSSLTANGTYTAPETSYTLAANLPGQVVSVYYKQTVIVTGTYGDTNVADGGTLKGTGTVGTLNVGGKLSPGLSPGCLNSGNLTFLTGSTYEFEVGGSTVCTEYDQTVVTGTVTLGNGTLSTILYNNFKPVKGQSYKIISNDAADAVTGTFKDLAEGATFTVGGYVFKISYVGGDGNDVVLTVQSVPAVPDTGFKLLQNNPIITLFTTTVLAGAMLLIAKKYGRSFNR